MKEDKRKQANPYDLSRQTKKKKPKNFNPYDLSKHPAHR